MKKYALFCSFVLFLSVEIGSANADEYIKEVSSTCNGRIIDYLVDGSRHRPDNSALALAIGSDGRCYWGAYSGVETIEIARNGAILDCKNGNGGVQLIKECKIFGVNKKLTNGLEKWFNE